MSQNNGGGDGNGDSNNGSGFGGKGRHGGKFNNNNGGNKGDNKHGFGFGFGRGRGRGGQSAALTDIGQITATTIAFQSFPPTFTPSLSPQQSSPFFNGQPFSDSIAPPTFLDEAPATATLEAPTSTITSISTSTSSTETPTNIPSSTIEPIATSDSAGTTSALEVIPTLPADDGPEITGPTSIEPCSQVTVSWTGGASPFEFKAFPGSGLQTPESWTQSTNDYVHSFYNDLVPPGDFLVLYITDSNGLNATRSYIVSGEASAACLAAMSTIQQEQASVALAAPTSSVKSSSSPMLTAPTLAGIGIGVVAVLTLVGMAIWLYRRKVVNRKSGALPFHIVTNNNSNNSSNLSSGRNNQGYNDDKEFPVTFDRQDSVSSRRTDNTERSRWSLTWRSRDRDRLAALEEAAGVQAHVDTTHVTQPDGFGPSLSTTPSQLDPTSGVTRQGPQVTGLTHEAPTGTAHSTASDQRRRHKPHPMYRAKPGLPSDPASAPKAPIIVELNDGGQPSPPFGDEHAVIHNDHDKRVHAMNGLASGTDVVDPFIIDFGAGIVIDSTEFDLQSQPQARRQPEMTNSKSRLSMVNNDASGPFGSKYAIKGPSANIAQNGQSGNQGHTSNGSQLTDLSSTYDSRIEFGDVLATKMDPALADILAKRMNRRAENPTTSTDPSGTDLPPRV